MLLCLTVFWFVCLASYKLENPQKMKAMCLHKAYNVFVLMEFALSVINIVCTCHF